VDATAPLLVGFLAGLAIAVQVGAVSLLLIDAALTAGPRAGAAGGMGVATVDLAYATVAVAAGGVARTVVGAHEAELRALAAVALSAIAVRGLRSLAREPSPSASAVAGAGAGVNQRGHSSAPAQYLRFLAITAVNPLTIVSFTSVAASLSLGGFSAHLAFVAGVGAASAGWHLVLTLVAAHVGRRITPRIHRALSIGGRLFVFGVALRLALAI
jgi:threonine/homoserine/homoserine lactone efflux protein